EAITLSDYPEAEGFRYWQRWHPQYRAAWRQTFEELPEFQRQSIRESLQDIARQESGAHRQQDLFERWYAGTGRMFEPVSFRDALGEDGPEEETGSETTIVNLNIELNREASEIQLTVDPQQPPERDSLDVPLTIYTRDGQQEREITVFRTGGEFSVSYEEPPRNVAVNPDKLPDGLSYFELKPLDMWLHQLERDPAPEQREAAALMMPRFRDDPDIQLAMQDFLRTEEDAEVRTAMIRSLSDIVDGASGTQQIFLDMARNAEGEELQAAVDALWPYEGNEDVKQQISRIVRRSENIGAVVSAISVYRQIATEEEFNTLASTILVSSRPALIRAAMLEELHRTDNTELAVGTSMDVAEATDFPYALRSRALETLARFEHYEELEEIMPSVIADADPRLRYLALQQLSFIGQEARTAFLEQRREREQDPRVREALPEE
ncbi:MAG: HEAT repeat domain-containing protein, partial [Cyclonatronaceae bacterium]